MEVIQLITICSSVDIVTFCFVTLILCNDFILLLLLTFANGEGIKTINGHITIDIFTFLRDLFLIFQYCNLCFRTSN